MSEPRLPAGRELVFVKLGGSVITDKRQPFTPRPQVIARLAGEVCATNAARPELQILLGHGSGSFGHVLGQKYGVRNGLPAGSGSAAWQGYVETGAVAAQLNRIVIDTFIQAGVPVFSVSPSSSARCQGGELVTMETYPIAEALRHRLVPLVYGDVAFDQIQGCTIVSTESVFAYLAKQFRPSRMILVGKVHGVFERDPVAHPDARHIARITPATIGQIVVGLGDSHGVDVTGGMLSKVQQAIALIEQQLVQRVHLISGLQEGALARAMLDPNAAEGTIIEA